MDKLHFKKAVKQNIIGKWFVSINNELQSRYYYHRRKKFIPQLSKLLVGEGISVISSNCFARTHYARLEIRV